MQFLVNYTFSEVIFNTIDQRWKKTSCEDTSERKEISISCKYGTKPAHQLLEVLHKNGIILDKVQVANNLLVLSCPSFIRINLSFVEYVVFLFLLYLTTVVSRIYITGKMVYPKFQPFDATAK